MGYISPEIPTATLLLSCFKQTFPCQVAKYPEAFGGRLVPSILAGQPPSILGQPPQFQQVSPLNFGLAPSILVGQPAQFWQVSPLDFGIQSVALDTYHCSHYYLSHSQDLPSFQSLACSAEIQPNICFLVLKFNLQDLSFFVSTQATGSQEGMGNEANMFCTSSIMWTTHIT